MQTETMEVMAYRIIKEIKRNDLLPDDVYDYILDAIKYYRLDPFFQSEGYINFLTQQTSNPGPTNFVFPNSLSKYNLPDVFVELDGVTCLFNGTALPLSVRSLDWFLEQCEGNPTVVGPPTDYLLFDNQIYFWPLADQQYQVTIWMKKATAAPTKEKPTEPGNFWMTRERGPMVRAMAKALLYAQKLRNTAQAQVERAIADALFSKLQSATYNNMFTGSPKSYDW